MRITKLLALATVAVVAVACNGTSPTSPTASVASDEATALVGAKAVKGPLDVDDCRDITEVQMRASDSAREITIEAVYLKRGGRARCGIAPDWSARPRGRLFPTKDPFVVKVARTRPPTAVHVTAEAPNGVRGYIRVR